MLSHDARLRCDLVDLYYTLYGSRRPVCLPIPELAGVLNPTKLKTSSFMPKIPITSASHSSNQAGSNSNVAVAATTISNNSNVIDVKKNIINPIVPKIEANNSSNNNIIIEENLDFMNVEVVDFEDQIIKVFI